jgi:hypothetical protein
MYFVRDWGLRQVLSWLDVSLILWTRKSTEVLLISYDKRQEYSLPPPFEVSLALRPADLLPFSLRS